VLNDKHQLIVPKLVRWIANVEILRVNELLVAAMFDQGAMSLKARGDFVFFGKHMAGYIMAV